MNLFKLTTFLLAGDDQLYCICQKVSYGEVSLAYAISVSAYVQELTLHRWRHIDGWMRQPSMCLRMVPPALRGP